MAVFLSQRWRRQPSGPMSLNSGHWATAGLIHSFVPWPALIEPATQVVWTKTGTPTISNGGAYTSGFIATTSGGNYYSTPDSVRNSPTKIMIVARVKKTNTGTTDGMLISKDDAATISFRMRTVTGGAPSQIGMGFNDGATWFASDCLTDIGGTGWRQVAGTYDGATLAYYVDRRLDSSSSKSGTLPDNAAAVVIGDEVTNGLGFVGSIEYLHIFDGSKVPVTISAVMALQEAPYAIFRPQQRRIYFDAPAAGWGRLLNTSRDRLILER